VRQKDPVSELRRGALELALLAFLDNEPSFGAAIMSGLAEVTDGGLVLTEGALYPALGRLEKKGVLVADWRKDVAGQRARKYYTLTATGKERLSSLRDAWKQLASGMQRLFGDED